MLKKLFAKKPVFVNNKTESDISITANLEPTMPSETQQSKSLPTLGNTSNNNAADDKENNPIATLRTKAMETNDIQRTERVIDFKCGLCKTSECLPVQAAGYCTACQVFVCGTCINCHFTEYNLRDHIMLQLNLITPNTLTYKQNGNTDTRHNKQFSDQPINENGRLQGVDNERKPVKHLNGDLSKQKDMHQDSVKDTNMEPMKSKCCDKSLTRDSKNTTLTETMQMVSKGIKCSDIKRSPRVSEDRKVNRKSSENKIPENENINFDGEGKHNVPANTKKDVKFSDNPNKPNSNGERKTKQMCTSHSKNVENKTRQSNGDKKETKVNGNVTALEKQATRGVIPVKLSFVKDIKVKYEGDAKNCCISGIAVLSDKRIAVQDDNNKNIKTLHVDWGIDGVIQFSNSVGDMTSLPNEQIAVTIPEEKRIKLLSTINEISVVANIRFLVEYYHIVYCNGKLLVSMQEPIQFRLLGLDGVLLQKVIPAPDVAKFIPAKQQMHVAISKDEKNIYVSNTETNALVAMDMSGELVAYKDTELEHPSGVIVVNGDKLFVCNTDRHTVYTMTQRFTDTRVLLNQDDGLLLPYCVCFYPEKNLVYVSSKSEEKTYSNNIKLFKG